MKNNDFYSIDKLVEFGMSVSIAEQMIKSMNSEIENMGTPQVKKNLKEKSESVYYAILDDIVEGPFSLSEISRLIKNKDIVKETYMWKPGMRDWDLAENISEILKIIALTPPPIPNEIKK